MQHFLTFLSKSTSHGLHDNTSLDGVANLICEDGDSGTLRSKISALEVELEDKEQSLKAMKELRERQKLKEEHIRRQMSRQFQQELAQSTVSLARWHFLEAPTY